MENNIFGENRRWNNRKRSDKKEEKRETEKMKNLKSEESASCSDYPIDDKDNVNIVEQDTLDVENFGNGDNNPKPLLMCPALRHQLQTHRNILRLLQAYKLSSTQINGQRILSIQMTGWNGPTPGIECEIFVGRIPKTIYEDTLYPLFNMVGEVFQIRLMVDMAEMTRGYCFIMYTNPEDAARAIMQLDQYEISPGKKIRVLASINKCKLYVGPLPWSIASEEVVKVIYASAWDIEYVSIYRFSNHSMAYAIVSFKSHRNAALARRKLRPEKLFKCNDVHVEWARVDWNPSNVYEDRGTVDVTGNVQITRKFLHSKNAASSSASTQKDSNRYQKQIPPICPPNSNRRANSFESINTHKSTRYSTMLTMSKLNDSLLYNKKLKVLTDINDNMEFLDGPCNIKNEKHWKDDTDANSYPNFDMWNSNPVPALLKSPIDSLSLKDYELPDKVPNEIRNEMELANDWESNTKYSLLKTSSFNGYRHLNNSDVSNCCHSYYNRHFDKTIDQNQSADTIQYQTVPHHPSASCCVLLQPQSYLYPKDIATYPQPSIANHICNDYDQMHAPLSTNCDYQSYWCNGQIDTHRPIAINQSPIVGKLSNFESWCREISAKTRNDTVALCPANLASNYVQDYTSNLALNVTPIYGSNPASENIFRFVLFNGNHERRPRPILKQTIGRT